MVYCFFHIPFHLYLGEAVDFAVQHAMSEAHGGRPNASKIAVIIVSERSEDPVDTAAYSASINSKFYHFATIFIHLLNFLSNKLRRRVKKPKR